MRVNKLLPFQMGLIALLLSLFSCKTGKPGDQMPERPKIIFKMSDDHACVTNSIYAPSGAVILAGKHSHLNGKID